VDTVVDTDGVFDRAVEALERFPAGLVVMNIQETDLAGHEQDPARYRSVLERVDRRLSDLRSRLTPDDLLVISADHGNDPSIGSSQHTREFVPVLMSGVDRRDVGTRETLADVGATLCEWLQLPLPQDGTPITATGRR
jgi:phosphopentomutase